MNHPASIVPETGAWHWAEVGFFIRRRDAAEQVEYCDELPVGWFVARCTTENHGYLLVFGVRGDVLEKDGALVRRILTRLGCF